MKAGILGGGQLGRMLLQAAANYTVETYVLESDPHCPAAHLCHHFVQGDIRNYDDVYRFGKDLDVLTIEIEAVNVEALAQLEAEGVRVFPSPKAIATIKNKILQKEFYKKHRIPTSAFAVTQNDEDVLVNIDFLPAVHKLAEGGYDGKGVQVINDQSELHRAFREPAVLEKKVNIAKEISVIVARDHDGNTTTFPVTEMIVNEELNLLDYQLSPAVIKEELADEARRIATKVVKALDSPGLFAVELFLDSNNEILVNETAPRVHNSGHHTIEANYCSQYDMLLRIMLGYPLGHTDAILPSAIVNLIGAEGFSGPAVYEGLESVLDMPGVFVHLYGKTTTKPGRKMGHVTILHSNYGQLAVTAQRIKDRLAVISNG
jgi:5-(carboxyamino)imidazole ribonucleotide synthase